MRRTRVYRTLRIFAVIVLVILGAGLIYFLSVVRWPSAPERKQTNPTAQQNGHGAGPYADATGEVKIISPASGRSVGGEISVVVRTVSHDSKLSKLRVGVCQQDPAWPTNWIEVSKDDPPRPDSSVQDNSGAVTSIYSWAWDTSTAHNGSYLLRVEATFTGDDGDERPVVSTEQAFSVVNLAVDGCDPGSYVLWKGEEGVYRPIAVRLKDNNLNRNPVGISLKIYPTEGSTDRDRPLRTLIARVASREPNAQIMTWTFKWNGRDSQGHFVPPGVYTYEVEAVQPADGDTAYYRSGEAENGRFRRDLAVGFARSSDRPGEALFAGEQNNGTPGKPDDDCYEYYISYQLRSDEDADAVDGQIRLLDPALKQIQRWSVADLVCRDHRGRHDGLDASDRWTQHSLLIQVPKKLMPPDGTYRFVLDFKDDRAYRYRQQSSRLALPITLVAPRYKIEGMRTGQFYVAWCRAESIDQITKRIIDVNWTDRCTPGGQLIGKSNSGMEGAAKLWVRDDPHKVLLVPRGKTKVEPEIFGTSRCQIRAAVNGGLMGLPIVQPVGDLGTDSGWRYYMPSTRRGLWAFSMARSGGGFTSAEVEKSEVYSSWMKRKATDACHAPKATTSAYPYGRGPVGLLVMDGVPKEAPPWWPPILPGSSLSVDVPLQRTAVAFSDDAGGGKRHFFLITASSCSWTGMANFLASGGGLERAVRPMLGRLNGHPVSFRISRAFMLDGGSSSQFAYRATDSAGQVVGRASGSSDYDLLLPGHNRPLTDIVTVQATCRDLGNHSVKRS